MPDGFKDGHMFSKKNTPAVESRLAPDAADFAPGLLAIQESPPARLPRAIMYTVGVLFGLLFLWSLFGKLDIIATAQGRLVPKSYTKIVQPSEAGVVNDILVVDGQEVTAGQVLLRMDATTATADLTSLGSDAALKGLTLRRIEAELSNKPFIPAASDAPELFGKVDAQFRARKLALSDSLAQEQAVYEKARFELIASEQIVEKLRATLPMYKQAANSYEKMVKEGYVSELGARDKARELVEKEQDFKAQQATVNSLKAAISQSERRTAQLRSGYASQLSSERVEVQSELQKSTAALTKQRYKSSMLELRAPQAGIVKDLAIHSRGTVVQPGTVLLNIVPQKETLVAEVLVSNEDAGFVRPGQSVQVKLASYPFQKYGMLDGKVIHVSADSNAPNPQQASAEQQMSYKAIVALDTQTLQRGQNAPLKLSPGMAVVAEIHQGSRTVMEYLISPVQKVAQESGRER